MNKISEFKKKISVRFYTQDLDDVNLILKIKVEKMHEFGWKIHQQNYIDDLINFYDMKNEKLVE